MDKYIGRLLDNRYEILELIGVGGMAVVYKARCHRLNRLVAIKILKDEYSQDEEFHRRFHAESQAVAMLSHPNIVSVYDVSTAADADYIVMELIDGITLKQYMEKKGVLNWKETLHFAMQIAKALEHAHSRGIVHRDIKPHNVMVLKNGSVKVTDFGIARVMSKSNTLTKEALGSVHYISPEQAKGGRVDNRSDIYSLGVVMFEMLTGRPPYDGESPVAVAIQHINGGAPMPSTLNPNIPGGLEQIIMKAMALEPNSRYTSATAMLYDMEEFRKDPTILFDFNDTPVDDATRIHTAPIRTETATPPRTTAERVARTGNTGPQGSRPVSRNTGANPPQRKTQPAQQHRKRQKELEEEENRSRITTIAVVACSAVVVVAIVIFLATLLNGGFSGDKDQEMVTVPQLIGQYYDEIPKEQNGITIIRGPGAYNDEYERGQIIDQNPDAGDEIYKGNQVVVTVSLGPEPLEKVMENITGLTETEARNFLNDLGLELVILPKSEASADVEAGRITRTEPVEGEPLTEGQTIKIWISTGMQIQMPYVVGMKYNKAYDLLTSEAYGFTTVTSREVESEKPKDEVVGQSVTKGDKVDASTEIILDVSKGPKTVVMPNVVGKQFATAEEILNDYGLTKISSYEVESDEPKGQVVTQSVDKGETVELSTKIILEISKGPAETTEDTTETTVSGEQLLTRQVELTLPTDRAVPYVLSLRLNGVKVVDDLEVREYKESVMVELTATQPGVVTYELYIDDQFYREEKVEFTIDG